MKIIKYILFLLFAVSLSGCRSSKHATSNLDKMEAAAAKTRYEAVVAQNFNYECLQAKMKYSLGGKSLSGKLNIEHGKRMCMTVTVLGIEVARIEATQDTVTVVDKVDKVYAKVSIAEAATKIGLQEDARLETLEALLLGRVYLPGKGLATKGDFSRFVWYPMENNELQADFEAARYLLSYVLDASNHLVATQVKVPASESTFVWEYAVPVELAGGSMPTQQTLSVSGSRTIAANIAMSAPSVAKKSWNSFQPSGSYRQVSFLELVEIVKKMKQ